MCQTCLLAKIRVLDAQCGFDAKLLVLTWQLLRSSSPHLVHGLHKSLSVLLCTTAYRFLKACRSVLNFSVGQLLVCLCYSPMKINLQRFETCMALDRVLPPFVVHKALLLQWQEIQSKYEALIMCHTAIVMNNTHIITGCIKMLDLN